MSESDHSPTALPNLNASSRFSIHEDDGVAGKGDPRTKKYVSVSVIFHNRVSDIELDSAHRATPSTESVPLVTSKLINTQSTKGCSSPSKKPKQDSVGDNKSKEPEEVSMESLIARLTEQQALLNKQKNELSAGEQMTVHGDQSDFANGSNLMTPGTESFTPATDDSEEHKLPQEKKELELLKKELEDAKNRLAYQEKELSQSRAMQHTLEHLKSAPTVSMLKTGAVGQGNTNGFESQHGIRQVGACLGQDDSKSDVSDASLAASMARGQNPWVHQTANGFGCGMQNQVSGRAWLNRPMAPNLTPLVVPQLPHMRGFSGPTSPTASSGSGRFFNDFGNGNRRGGQGPRNGQGLPTSRNQGWDSFNSSREMSPVVGVNPQLHAMEMFQGPVGYQARPIGTPLSPTAAEFTGNGPVGPWNQPTSPGQTYVSPMEPLNYRRLLDRSVTCNWKYIVDKIVCNNDQQASIFLQQKLKVGTVEQKYEIVEAIVAQAYPLMVNRFGNFLVQRCFEHGTPEQVVAIANAIRGSTLSLSMDAFGCHVVQKAFDAVPEQYKAIMVHELLRRIPETVIHRYACHVWQKLFELRWSDSPPQIMKHVNEALRGMWHEVALGETGSLVVQNIFENCLEEDKRPCINEVLNSIDIVAHGQFGNWCIQHICEHGAPADRSRAIDHVLRYATEYSMDQFASKVVEKCLKIGGSEFLERYLERVCEGRPDRPRIPLIDISSDQYGNYLVQYILTHANAQHREIVASHIRKHMVSLRGSKFGSRVGMLCSNPAYATRPGPGAGPSTNRFSNGSSSNRFNGQFR